MGIMTNGSKRFSALPVSSRRSSEAVAQRTIHSLERHRLAPYVDVASLVHNR